MKTLFRVEVMFRVGDNESKCHEGYYQITTDIHSSQIIHHNSFILRVQLCPGFCVMNVSGAMDCVDSDIDLQVIREFEDANLVCQHVIRWGSKLRDVAFDQTASCDLKVSANLPTKPLV